MPPPSRSEASRPWREEDQSPGIAVDLHAHSLANELNRVVDEGLRRHPRDHIWEVIGADSSNECEQDEWPEGFAVYAAPEVYGEFDVCLGF